MRGLCSKHRKQHDGWMDYNHPIDGWIQFGTNEDRRAQHSFEVYNAKVEDRNKLIREHTEGIREFCRDNRGCTPRLLDLFCCAGGAGVGYKRAGFDVYGVDIDEQANYPFSFHRGDALGVLYALLSGGSVRFDGEHGAEELFLSDFAALHASPPCQASCSLTKGTNKGRVHLNLIPQTRDLLSRVGVPTVIENVQGSDLRRDLTLCGERFRLKVIRHRYFEVSVPVVQPAHVPHRGRVAGYRHGEWYDGPYFAVYGDGGGKGSVAQWQDAMGIDWTFERRELAESIPPAYSEFIGGQLLSRLSMEVAA